MGGPLLTPFARSHRGLLQQSFVHSFILRDTQQREKKAGMGVRTGEVLEVGSSEGEVATFGGSQ